MLMVLSLLFHFTVGEPSSLFDVSVFSTATNWIFPSDLPEIRSSLNKQQKLAEIEMSPSAMLMQ